jgi:hypothetical protein
VRNSTDNRRIEQRLVYHINYCSSWDGGQVPPGFPEQIGDLPQESRRINVEPIGTTHRPMRSKGMFRDNLRRHYLEGERRRVIASRVVHHAIEVETDRQASSIITILEFWTKILL